MTKKKTAKKKVRKKARRKLATKSAGTYGLAEIKRMRLTSVHKQAKKTATLKRWLAWYPYSSNTSCTCCWYIYVQATMPSKTTRGDWRATKRCFVSEACEFVIPKRYRDEAKRTGEAVLMTTLSE